MHQTHPTLSSLNLPKISVFDLANFSIGCREVEGREVGGEGCRGRGRLGEAGKEKDEEEGERKEVEKDSRYGAYNRV